MVIIIVINIILIVSVVVTTAPLSLPSPYHCRRLFIVWI